MARPGQLANALAEVFDLDPATVRHQARMLRDASLMTMEKGGRGPGTMEPHDAVHLLLAAAGASRVKHSTAPVLENGSRRSEGAWHFPFEGPPELLALPETHTLVEALVALLGSAINGSITREPGALGLKVNGAGSPSDYLSVTVTLSEPHAHSTISIGVLGSDENATAIRDEVTRHYQDQWRPGIEAKIQFDATRYSDLSRTHRFTDKAIFRVAREFWT